MEALGSSGGALGELWGALESSGGALRSSRGSLTKIKTKSHIHFEFLADPSLILKNKPNSRSPSSGGCYVEEPHEEAHEEPHKEPHKEAHKEPHKEPDRELLMRKGGGAS